MFLNSLGTDFRIWENVIAELGGNVPTLCLDKRGHGLTDDGPILMDLLVADVTALMDHLSLPTAILCGVSVGGMIAQGVAAKRPDLAAGLVLCCTGVKIGNIEGWNTRIDTVQQSGIATIADAVLDRWFSDGFKTQNAEAFAGYRNMLIRTSPRGYAGVCSAIRDTDLTPTSKKLNLPTHCIAGADDLATPPALVRSLAECIPGATFELIERVGHLPCIEAPGRIASAVRQMRAVLS